MTTRIDTRDTCKLCIRVKPNYCKRHAPKMTVTKTMLCREIVICAAVLAEDGYIARGHRHCHCLSVLAGMKKTPAHYHDGQGFMTSFNRYVNRREGLALQLAAGIKSVNKGGYINELYSEDLY